MRQYERMLKLRPMKAYFYSYWSWVLCLTIYIVTMFRFVILIRWVWESCRLLHFISKKASPLYETVQLLSTETHARVHTLLRAPECTPFLTEPLLPFTKRKVISVHASRVEVELDTFVTFALHGDGWPASRPGRFTSAEKLPVHNTFLQRTQQHAAEELYR